VSRHLLTEPKSDAQLFDMLHGLFGIGDYDDASDTPWFKHRMTEVIKIKAIRRKRQVSLREWALAARYAYRTKAPIRQSHDVLFYLDKARKEQRTARVSDLGQQIADAITNERSRGDDASEAWVRRLLLARGDYRRELLQEWAESRS
jgi:hypothetical protein